MPVIMQNDTSPKNGKGGSLSDIPLIAKIIPSAMLNQAIRGVMTAYFSGLIRMAANIAPTMEKPPPAIRNQ